MAVGEAQDSTSGLHQVGWCLAEDAGKPEANQLLHDQRNLTELAGLLWVLGIQGSSHLVS
jgi:hypothetical protein